VFVFYGWFLVIVLDGDKVGVEGIGCWFLGLCLDGG